MTREAIDKLLAEYASEIQTSRENGTQVIATVGKRDAIDDGIFAQLDHMTEMIAKMRLMDDPAKLNRWLGFLQGAFWIMQIRTIDEMRKDTRGAVDRELRAPAI